MKVDILTYFIGSVGQVPLLRLRGFDAIEKLGGESQRLGLPLRPGEYVLVVLQGGSWAHHFQGGKQ